MFDPTKITFEDDILMIIKNFIKKTGAVSDTIFNVLPQLEKVFTKNKNCFGDALMDTLNFYMIYGRERFLAEPGAIQMLLRIADLGMFGTEPNITVNNSEGAIFLAIIF
jgi:hypothetical protein